MGDACYNVLSSAVQSSPLFSILVHIQYYEFEVLELQRLKVRQLAQAVWRARSYTDRMLLQILLLLWYLYMLCEQFGNAASLHSTAALRAHVKIL